MWKAQIILKQCLTVHYVTRVLHYSFLIPDESSPKHELQYVRFALEFPARTLRCNFSSLSHTPLYHPLYFRHFPNPYPRNAKFIIFPSTFSKPPISYNTPTGTIPNIPFDPWLFLCSVCTLRPVTRFILLFRFNMTDEDLKLLHSTTSVWSVSGLQRKTIRIVNILQDCQYIYKKGIFISFWSTRQEIASPFKNSIPTLLLNVTFKFFSLDLWPSIIGSYPTSWISWRMVPADFPPQTIHYPLPLPLWINL